MTRVIRVVLLIGSIFWVAAIDATPKDFENGLIVGLTFGAGMALQDGNESLGLRGFGFLLMVFGFFALLIMPTLPA
jgi:hypothetical protein